MKIDDNWFLNSMLVNTLSQTAKTPSQSMPTGNLSGALFSAILNQFLDQMQLETTFQSVDQPSFPSMISTSAPLTGQPVFSSYIPNQVPSITPDVNKQKLPIGGDDSLGFQMVNPEKLDQVLDGKLKGMGEVFVQAGQQFNINPALLAAIAQHESANGKSHAAAIKNNIAGMMGSNGLKSYSTVEESIMDMARNLSKNYLGSGLNSIAEIGAKYAPQGAANDPTGLNNYWVSGVSRYFNQIRV
ncbi:glucosaminidase domain-containing protein [Neobacillus cucumis]|nr:glucosaminidase domain-containing protein [Neobacillus cucumis]